MQEPTSTMAADNGDSPTSKVASDSLVLTQIPPRPQSPCGRTWSYQTAVAGHWDHVQPSQQMPVEDVRAGLQANLRLFILHSSEVFMASEDPGFLEKQVQEFLNQLD